MSVAKHEFSCVRCGADHLFQESHLLVCRSCGTTYPIVYDLPILFPDVVVDSVVVSIDIEEVAQSVCDYQGLPKNSIIVERLKGIFSKNYRFTDTLLDVESKQYLERVKSTRNHQDVVRKELLQSVPTQKKKLIRRFLPQFFKLKLKKIKSVIIKRFQKLTTTSGLVKSMGSGIPFAIQYKWVLDYLPRVCATERFTGNVRLHNCGETPISSQGPTPVMISYHWHTTSTDNRQSPPDVIEYRTPLPIDLKPGQQITIPMLIQPPEQAGRYELELCLVQEYVCWHEANSIRIPIEVVSIPLPDMTVDWQKQPLVGSYNYFDDHKRGVSLLKAHLKTLDQVHPKILEIGGNSSPILFDDFPGQLYNLDIDVHGLQIGLLCGNQNNKNVTFLCADAHKVPFPDNYFDCITIFASLHHFPDLRVTLRSLATKINPQGFLAIMCEPVGHPYGEYFDPVFLEELLKGVNEQSFSLSEYAEIFRDSGLVVDHVIVDGSSLKAFLKKYT